MASSETNAVRFTLKDDERQDSEEIRKLNALSLHGGNQVSDAFMMTVAADGVATNGYSPVISSGPASRRSSRGETSHPQTTSGSGSHSRIHSPDASPPGTPRGDPTDPYRRSARLPQSKSLADIPPQFIFSKLDPLAHHKVKSPSSSHISLSSFFHHHHLSKDHSKDPSTGVHTPASDPPHKTHSGFDLGRFFRHGSHKGKHDRAHGLESPPHSSSRYNSELESKVPKKVKGEDEHAGLYQKYDKGGKILGSGAGGSVRIMERLSDKQLVAVKDFRERGALESQKDYNKKVTAEFCVASAMHHSNVIETIEVLKDNNKWYQIMEYAPFDMFAIVMTGEMSRVEIFCCFKQLLRGVEYLHDMGLAHRDLKLDNLVMDEHGIVKIIDFGSAVVFRYPFEEERHDATGVVGSDPYLAPEICTQVRYAPEPADMWSCAIIFCCMWLRRFPWKSPRPSDNSFKSFITPDAASLEVMNSLALTHLPTETSNIVPADPSQVIRGPWRLLRLLPRESRNAIRGLLEIDPHQRFSMRELVNDQWIKSIEMCYEDKQTRTVHKATNHTHILVQSDHAKAKTSRD